MNKTYNINEIIAPFSKNPQKKLTVIELFSGIGAQAAALENLGVDFEVIGVSEIDHYAIEAYNKIHKPVLNFGDITKIESLPYCDILTYSFPCTDISVQGKQEGIKEGTRSGLLLEVEQLLKVAQENNTLPKVLVLENVKNLVQKKFIKDFNRWEEFLENLGYCNNWQVLQAIDFGVPQSRERVIMVSVLNSNLKVRLDFKKKDLPPLSSFLLPYNELPEEFRSPTEKHIAGVMENMPDKNRWYVIDNQYSTRRPPRFYDTYSPTLLASSCDRLLVWDTEHLRRISGIELFTLMGFNKEQVKKLVTGKKTIDGRLAGNSIVVPVLEAVFQSIIDMVNFDAIVQLSSNN